MQNYHIKFAKVNPKAIIPTKKDDNAGWDIFSCIDYDWFINPSTTRLIPTGIAYEITPGWHLKAAERGSTGKIGLKTSAGINDNSYRGEVFAFLYNGSKDKTIVLSVDEERTKERLVRKNEKYLKEKFGEEYKGFNKEKFLERYIIFPTSKAIQQLVPIYSPNGTSEEVPYDQLSQTERGDGMLGSTENKEVQ